MDAINIFYVTREKNSKNYTDLCETLKSLCNLNLQDKVLVIVDVFKNERPEMVKTLISTLRSKGWIYQEYRLEEERVVQAKSLLGDGGTVPSYKRQLKLIAGQTITRDAFTKMALEAYKDTFKSFDNNRHVETSKWYHTPLVASRWWRSATKWDYPRTIPKLVIPFYLAAWVFTAFRYVFLHFWFIYSNVLKWTTLPLFRYTPGLGTVVLHVPGSEFDQNRPAVPQFAGRIRGTTPTSSKDLISLMDGISPGWALISTLFIVAGCFRVFETTGSFRGFPTAWVIYFGGLALFLVAQRRVLRWKLEYAPLYLVLTAAYPYLFPLFLALFWVFKLLASLFID